MPAHQVTVSLDRDTWYQGTVSDVLMIPINCRLSPGWHDLAVDFFGRSDLDHDQSLRIQSIHINSISDPRFVWKGTYVPVYPEPWATQQIDAGHILEPELTNTDFMGWNGTWNLRFSSPVFTWIHQTQSLGWIYD